MAQELEARNEPSVSLWPSRTPSACERSTHVPSERGLLLLNDWFTRIYRFLWVSTAGLVLGALPVTAQPANTPPPPRPSLAASALAPPLPGGGRPAGCSALAPSRRTRRTRRPLPAPLLRHPPSTSRSRWTACSTTRPGSRRM